MEIVFVLLYFILNKESVRNKNELNSWTYKPLDADKLGCVIFVVMISKYMQTVKMDIWGWSCQNCVMIADTV